MKSALLHQISLDKIVLFIALLLLFFLAFNAGISGDEQFNRRNAKKVIEYFKTGGEDKSYLEEGKNNYAYPYTIDVVNQIIVDLFNIDDFHGVRHIINALLTWLILVFSFLIANKYFGLSSAVITVIILLLSPRFVGHGVNNPRDIPFALGYIMTIWAILKFNDELYSPRWRTILKVIFCLALALITRIGALILIPYFVLFVAIRIMIRRGRKTLSNTKYYRQYMYLTGIVLLIIIGAYSMMVSVWPYALADPLNNPIDILQNLTNFNTGIRQLFEGANTPSDRLPWYYTFKWIMMTIPLIVYLGLISLVLLLITKKLSKKRKYVIFCLFLVSSFPLIYIIYKDSNVYGGWRHMTFTYPPLACLAGIGIGYLYDKSKAKIFRFTMLALFGILCLLPIRHYIVNFPIQYVYFNEIFGGAEKAFGKYELDYYMHSVRPAVKWLKENELVDRQDTKTIVTSNHSYSTKYYFRNDTNVAVNYTRYYERLKKDWDYGIYVNVYIDQPELANDYFPPTGTIHTIDVDGVPVCAIVKRPSKASIGYHKDISSKNYLAAKSKLLDYRKADSDNFEANMSLAIVYSSLRHQDSTQYFINEARRVNPLRTILFTGGK